MGGTRLRNGDLEQKLLLQKWNDTDKRPTIIWFQTTILEKRIVLYRRGLCLTKPTSPEIKTIKKFTLWSTRKDNYSWSLTSHFNYKSHYISFGTDQDCTEERYKGQKRVLLKIDTLIYATIFHSGFKHLNCIIFKVEVYFTISDSI